MTPCCCWLTWLVLLCSPLWHPEGVQGWSGLSTVPSESECRPYIEKALKELSPETSQEAVDTTGSEHTTTPSQSADREGSIEEPDEATTKESLEDEAGDETKIEGEDESNETNEGDKPQSAEEVEGEEATAESTEGLKAEPTESLESTEAKESTPEEAIEGTSAEESKEEDTEEGTPDQPSVEDGNDSVETGDNIEETSSEDTQTAEGLSTETTEDNGIEEKSAEEEKKSGEENEDETLKSTEQEETSRESGTTEETKPEEDTKETAEEVSKEEPEQELQHETEESKEKVSEEILTSTEDQAAEDSVENTGGEVIDSGEVNESSETIEPTEAAGSFENETAEEPKESLEDTTEASGTSGEGATDDSVEKTTETPIDGGDEVSTEETAEVTGDGADEISTEQTTETPTEESAEETPETIEESSDATEASSEAGPASGEVAESAEEKEPVIEPEVASESIEATPTTGESAEESQVQSSEEPGEQEQAEEEESTQEPEPTVEDQLTLEFETPKVRRSRDHIGEILHLTPESAETEMLLAKTTDTTLKELKKLYDVAIKPLEILFKYRDLSNRHFGDPEIFSKPLILFMGPWSGGKSTILNYLLDNEFKASSLRTGAEPSPAYFNILMWGEREEVLDGTQLAADWTFSGLQKFGQGLLDRLRGLRLNSPLLEKVNIVEIPGILEIRKQVERLFPFNDACQWFIDRADIIFLVYDPSKLDVGPETEAILDQLKGREYQTRIILNKADQVKPEELMRVQGTLIWNISPLMSSPEPPVMYSASLWSIPYEQGAPSRLLHAQERAFLRDLRQAIDKRVDNKIASARRFAVRVRNHAKMVDCYLTTYYNHKTFFGNRKKVADDIIEHPQNYHIYEGLSTLTNISRYDLPDPEVYRDFFQLNALYDFQRLSETCTYFRGCPINRLDVAIAYDLPELVGKYKKQAEKVLEAAEKQATKS